MRRATAALLLAAGLAGCGLTPSSSDGIDSVTTGSITPAATPAPTAAPPATVVGSLDQSDWEAIRAVAAGQLSAAADGRPLAWANADTGNSGTIAAVAAAASRGRGLSCRPIDLTVSDVRGVRRYHGDACRLLDGSWQLSDMTADDKTLL